MGRITAKESRAYTYLDRINGQDAAPLLAETRDFWNMEHAEGLRYWKSANRLTRHRLVLIMNVFEELGQMHRGGLVDERVTRDSLAFMSRELWDEAEWFVTYLRTTRGEDDLWDEWEAMNHRLAQPLKTWHGIGDLWMPGCSIFNGGRGRLEVPERRQK